jgi:hypothetical protein
MSKAKKETPKTPESKSVKWIVTASFKAKDTNKIHSIDEDVSSFEIERLKALEKRGLVKQS